MSVDTGYGVRGLARFPPATSTSSAATSPPASGVSPTRSRASTTWSCPPVLLEFCDMPMGLVLVTGPTGSGKSTSLGGAHPPHHHPPARCT